LNLIKKKKIEAELLALLKWSHEESLKSMGEYQEREKNYELAVSSYQKRLSELLAAGGDAAVLNPESPDYYQDMLNAADTRIAELEARLAAANTKLMVLQGNDGEKTSILNDSERNLTLLKLKADAAELNAILNKKLSEVEK
jgi:hypothetical protein